MIHAQNEKTQVMFLGSVASSATQSGYVDTQEWDYCEIGAYYDSVTATTDNPVVLTVGEGTTTSFTESTAIGTFTGDDTTDGFTIPDGSASAQAVSFLVNCKQRERYLFLSFTPDQATQIAAGVAKLSRGKLSPTTAAEAGVAAQVIG